MPKSPKPAAALFARSFQAEADGAVRFVSRLPLRVGGSNSLIFYAISNQLFLLALNRHAKESRDISESY